MFLGADGLATLDESAWEGVGKLVAKMTQQFGVTLCFFPFISGVRVMHTLAHLAISASGSASNVQV